MDSAIATFKSGWDRDFELGRFIHGHTAYDLETIEKLGL